jgi:hypothetical protein
MHQPPYLEVKTEASFGRGPPLRDPSLREKGGWKKEF